MFFVSSDGSWRSSTERLATGDSVASSLGMDERLKPEKMYGDEG